MKEKKKFPSLCPVQATLNSRTQLSQQFCDYPLYFFSYPSLPAA